MLGIYEQLHGRRASQGTREGSEETHQKDGKAKTWRRTCRVYNKYKQLENSIEEFRWEREDDRSTLEMEEPEQQQVVYITNLENGLQKDGTKSYDEEGPNEKKPAAKNRHIEEPSLNNLNHVFEVYEGSGSDIDYIEDFLRERTKRTQKKTTTLIWMRRRKESELTYYNWKNHDIITIFQEKRRKCESSGHEGNGTVKPWRKHLHR